LLRRLFQRRLKDEGKQIDREMFWEGFQEELLFEGGVWDGVLGRRGDKVLEHGMEFSKE
jgi:hypothetical protein